MAMFRCLNPDCSDNPHKVQFDFWADKPLCPSCGTDGETADGKNVVGLITTIHYDPPHTKRKNCGKNTLACMPERSVFGLAATGEPSVVNCPKCKETDVYKANVPAKYEENLKADQPKTQLVVEGRGLEKMAAEFNNQLGKLKEMAKTAPKTPPPVDGDEFAEAGCCG
jgi:hypothetical protein